MPPTTELRRSLPLVMRPAGAAGASLVLLPWLKPPDPGAQHCPPEQNTQSQCRQAPSAASVPPHSLPLRAPSRLAQRGSHPRGPCARDCGRAALGPAAAADAGQNEASPHGAGLWGLTAVRMACAAAMLLLPSILDSRRKRFAFGGDGWGLFSKENFSFSKQFGPVLCYSATARAAAPHSMAFRRNG